MWTDLSPMIVPAFACPIARASECPGPLLLPRGSSEPLICLHARLFSMAESLSPPAVTSPILVFSRAYLHMPSPFTCLFGVLSYYTHVFHFTFVSYLR